MCGIAGFVDFNQKLDKSTLISITDVLHHRGPDDSGYSFFEASNATIGLGHRRLSILDLSSHGHQPMIHENLEIIYNGEVYNFKEIRKELETYNYTFESDSDTEVICEEIYEEIVYESDTDSDVIIIGQYDDIENEFNDIQVHEEYAEYEDYEYYLMNESNR